MRTGSSDSFRRVTAFTIYLDKTKQYTLQTSDMSKLFYHTNDSRIFHISEKKSYYCASMSNQIFPQIPLTNK